MLPEQIKKHWRDRINTKYYSFAHDCADKCCEPCPFRHLWKKVLRSIICNEEKLSVCLGNRNMEGVFHMRHVSKIYDITTGAFWMQNLCSFTTLPDSFYAQTHTDAPGQTLLNVRCTNALLVLRVVATSRVLLYSYRHHAHRKISFSIRVFLFLNPLRVRDSGSEWHAHPGVNNFQLLLSLIIQSALRNAFNTPISDAWNDGYIGRYSNKI